MSRSITDEEWKEAYEKFSWNPSPAPLEFKYTKLDPNGRAPEKSDGDVGWDLRCIEDEGFSIPFRSDYLGQKILDKNNCYELATGERHVFRTGISIELPQGYHAIFKPRSGLAVKNGIHVMAGVIDNSYRGELLICLLNTGKHTVSICEGDKICQMIIIEEQQGYFTEAKELSETDRGHKGFGSTGR